MRWSLNFQVSTGWFLAPFSAASVSFFLRNLFAFMLLINQQKSPSCVLICFHSYSFFFLFTIGQKSRFCQQEVLLRHSGCCNLIKRQLSPDWIKGLVAMLLFNIWTKPVCDFQSWSEQRLNLKRSQSIHTSFFNGFYWQNGDEWVSENGNNEQQCPMFCWEKLKASEKFTWADFQNKSRLVPADCLNKTKWETPEAKCPFYF